MWTYSRKSVNYKQITNSEPFIYKIKHNCDVKILLYAQLAQETTTFVFQPKLYPCRVFKTFTFSCWCLLLKNEWAFFDVDKGDTKHVHGLIWIILFGECNIWLIVLSSQQPLISWIVVFFNGFSHAITLHVYSQCGQSIERWNMQR